MTSLDFMAEFLKIDYTGEKKKKKKKKKKVISAKSIKKYNLKKLKESATYFHKNPLHNLQRDQVLIADYPL